VITGVNSTIVARVDESTREESTLVELLRRVARVVQVATPLGRNYKRCANSLNWLKNIGGTQKHIPSGELSARY
jgi:hypothetical protein